MADLFDALFTIPFLYLAPIEEHLILRLPPSLAKALRPAVAKRYSSMTLLWELVDQALPINQLYLGYRIGH